MGYIFVTFGVILFFSRLQREIEQIENKNFI